jgi:hypothetical protein
MKHHFQSAVALVFAFLLGASMASAQTTTFTYQGRITDGGPAASGQYDFIFRLYNLGGTQIGTDFPVGGVQVTNGIFTVQLDFTAPDAFDGSQRFLEIAVKKPADPSFTTLSPRQPITSAPYSIKSLNADNASNAVNATNATQLGGVAANQYVLTGDSRMTDARNPLAGSANYIQNQNAAPQATSNFDISGTGRAATFNAVTQYNIGGNRVLSSPVTSNIFVGVGAGNLTMTGTFNSFLGFNSGDSNTSGNNNAFFGQNAGQANTTGGSNSFFGETSGFANNIGFANSFFGASSGLSTTTGTNNTFVGREAGMSNTTGSSNTIIGNNANVGANNLNFATAIGADAVVNASNAVVLGRNLDTVQVPGNLAVTGSFFANGSNLTNLNASTISSGTLDNARLGVVPIANGGTGSATGSGASLNNLNATNISSGTLDNARLGVVPITNGGTGSATQNFVDLTNSQTVGGNKTFSATLSGNIVNAGAQYDLGGSRILSNAGNANLFAGVNAGSANTTGFDNSFFGRRAGELNTTGDDNSFFGAGAGAANTTGDRNSFFGAEAGNSNTTGFANSFFGRRAGELNTTADFNSFFGAGAGAANTTGSGNSFFGAEAGNSNTTGFENSFVGRGAGDSNSTGAENSFFGAAAGNSNTTGGGNSFVGRGAGGSNSTGFENSFFGRFAGGSNSTGTNNSFFGHSAGITNTTGDNNTVIGNSANVGSGDLSFATAIGAGALVDSSNTLVLARSTDTVFVPGLLRAGELLQVDSLGTAGSTPLCRNASDQIATCSSSARYKSNVTPFRGGLEILSRLRPVSFNWKDGGMLDLGLVAEDVAKVEPLLTTTNAQGEIEGVKYDRIGVVLINAVKEQQAQIEAQRERDKLQQQHIERLQGQIDALKKLVCSQAPQSEACKEEK